MIRNVLCAVTTYAMLPIGWAASFDCGKARTRTEKLICSTPELSKADDALAAAYRKALTAATKLSTAERSGLIEDEASWLKSNVAHCRNAGCISAAYSDRIAALEFYAAEAASPPRAADGPTGSYSIVSAAMTGSLEALLLHNGNLRFSFELTSKGVVSVYVGLAAGTVPIKDNVAIWTDPDDKSCELRMEFSHKKVTVQQKGLCEASLGEHISAAGEYHKLNSLIPVFVQ